ncbi:Flp pilus assembly complex ATPase component TadA (plasmid) [Comamonas aquatica]|nr:Flp pilus assembly complex ATPase component TadA [Comamonas aquatica]
MFKFKPFLKKNHRSIIDDAQVLSAVVSNAQGLPSYSRIVDHNTSPALWSGVENKSTCVILIDDNRNASIVIDSTNKSNKKIIDKINANLKNQAYISLDVVVVSTDLMQKLRGYISTKGYSERLSSLKSEPLVRFRNWLETALKMKATDLHLETIQDRGQVRVRAHGEVWPLNDAVSGKYRSEQITESIGSIFQNLTLGSSNSSSMWKASADSYTMLMCEVGGKEIKLRFQATSGHQGPKAVLRILNGSESPSQTLGELGYPKSHLVEFERAQQTTNGLICLAGITGSGKTTSIRSFIETHPDNGQIVINTVEDPVELIIKGAHQKSIQRSFEDSDEDVRKKIDGAIASMLRSDIDIGVLGELRDKMTANAWLNMAETGHMGIATLHAHRLTGIVPRLCNETMGLNLDDLMTPQVINLFAYQALIPANCPVCKLETDELLRMPGVEHSKTMNALKVASDLDLDPTYFRWRNPHGCSACNKRGTEGQALLAELLTPDYQWLDLMRSRRFMEANDYHRSRGTFDLKSEDMYCRSIVEHGLLKVIQGEIDITTLSRFEKLSDFAANFNRLKGGNNVGIRNS